MSLSFLCSTSRHPYWVCKEQGPSDGKTSPRNTLIKMEIYIILIVYTFKQSLLIMLWASWRHYRNIDRFSALT